MCSEEVLVLEKSCIVGEGIGRWCIADVSSLADIILVIVVDVAVDIRVGSPTFGQWISEVLSGTNHRQMYIPPGFAHGYCVASETAIFSYKCTDFYDPATEGGIIWNDPGLAIDWPLANPILSDKDGDLPNLQNSANGGPAAGGHRIQAAAEYTSTVETAGYG